ncbi:MAG TPA: hypothetical protein VFB66_01825 [Tepidisphaeraceae bacterium]|nr:hypothetical protein [Tepidisphaeraceae bacterium]
MGQEGAAVKVIVGNSYSQVRVRMIERKLNPKETILVHDHPSALRGLLGREVSPKDIEWLPRLPRTLEDADVELFVLSRARLKP